MIHRPGGTRQEMCMKTPDTIRRVKKPRVPLTEQDRDLLVALHGGDSVPMLVKRTGLPYILVYNVVRGRVKSISDRHYRKLFGQPPPHRRLAKVDGGQFRRMARLWLFLNEDLTPSELYREYYGTEHPRRPDLRIFNGKIRMVDAGLTRFMHQKFAEAGIDGALLDRWLDEMDALPHHDRVAYSQIQPLLAYLQKHLGIHPTAILNQTVQRYESGLLQSVSMAIYDHALSLKRKTEQALAANDSRELEKLKESILGKKTGYTLYLDIREALHFLRKHAKKSARRYLGRSTWIYETGKARRVADWRARKILHDCEMFIREHPDLPLSALPERWQRQRAGILIDVMISRLAKLLSQQEGMNFEKRILAPAHARDTYTNRYHGMTRFDMAPGVLGMRRKAFDLMVARHCDIFRAVGTYAKRWYVSDLYLKELSQKKYFNLISARYEILAKQSVGTGGGNNCLH
jgi:hypothetical protein